MTSEILPAIFNIVDSKRSGPILNCIWVGQINIFVYDCNMMDVFICVHGLKLRGQLSVFRGVTGVSKGGGIPGVHGVPKGGTNWGFIK